MNTLEFTHQINSRTKSIKLKFCAYRGLIITTPKAISNQRLQKIYHQHQSWIEHQQRQFAHIKPVSLPTTIDLPLLNISRSIRVNPAQKSALIETLTPNTVSLKSTNLEQQIKQLKQWIRRQAKEVFATKLKHWAQQTGLNYRKLNVRSQKSRWGSCSSTGTISLNDQLLFMPMSVLDYIIVHELCHTVEANHSAHFWALVKRHCPDYQQQERLLAQHTKNIPHWFRASLYQ